MRDRCIIIRYTIDRWGELIQQNISSLLPSIGGHINNIRKPRGRGLVVGDGLGSFVRFEVPARMTSLLGMVILRGEGVSFNMGVFPWVAINERSIGMSISTTVTDHKFLEAKVLKPHCQISVTPGRY